MSPQIPLWSAEDPECGGETNQTPPSLQKMRICGKVEGYLPDASWIVTLSGTCGWSDAVLGMNPTAMVLHRYAVGLNGVLGFEHFFCSTNDCYDL